jgi:glycine oxidase
LGERVIVLGGGVIGLASALECAKRGFQVTLLEKGKCGGQASGAAAGMLAPFSEIEEDPDDFFRLCYASLEAYPKWQQEVKELSHFNFEYTNSGSLHGVFHDADILSLETTKRWHREFQVEAELLDQAQIEKIEPYLTKDIVAALHYPAESHLYAPDYVVAMEKACREIGVHIADQLEEIEVTEWRTDIQVKSKNGLVYESDFLVVSTGAWSGELEHTFGIQIPVFPIRGQICAYQTEPEKLNHIVFTSQGYFVRKETGTLVCGATEDIAGFDTRVTEKGIQRLTNWTPKVFPFLQDVNPFHRWAGLRPATQDGFPLLGLLEEQKRVIFATGHYRNGILLSPITAITVANLVEGKDAPVPLRDFAPERFTT